ncbi:MAG: sulfite exporter TauE/SafE family protein [Pirellulaceae bacterium]|nr:sulfite exporter TauE/SafE family protein [Pirellulaceae bacterium]
MHNHSVELTVGLGFLLGMLHAIEPGHGKTAMFVYMLRQRRAFWHPIAMGVSTALSHALSLVIIALLVHFGTHWLAGDTHAGERTVSQCLQWISSLILIGIGVRLLFLARASAAKPRTCRCCHTQANSSEHATEHACLTMSASMSAPVCAPSGSRQEASEQAGGPLMGISVSPALLSRTTGASWVGAEPLAGWPNSVACTASAQPEAGTPSGFESSVTAMQADSPRQADSSSQLRLTMLLGFAIGLLPCPTALAAYFAGLSSGSALEGFRVILVFSAGIACSLVLCGYVLQWVGERLSGWLPGDRSMKRLAYAQAAVILLVGLVHLWQLYQGHSAH